MYVYHDGEDKTNTFQFQKVQLKFQSSKETVALYLGFNSKRFN